MIDAARNCINTRSSAVLYSATGIGAAILVGGLIFVAVTKPATATPPTRRRRSRIVAGATRAQPVVGHLPILAKRLPRTGTNYPRNGSERHYVRLRTNSGSLAIFAAIRRASSRVTSLALV